MKSGSEVGWSKLEYTAQHCKLVAKTGAIEGVVYLAQVMGLDALLYGIVRQLTAGDMLQELTGPVVLCYPAVLPDLIYRRPADMGAMADRLYHQQVGATAAIAVAR